ncbi:MAG: cytochrome d ubiquinol oxidase subunit II, partial [Cypionkella sp.]
YPLDGPSNPLHFEVERTASWLAAYGLRPWIVIAPLMGVFGALLAVWGLRAGREVVTLLASKLAIFGVISSVGLTMFPFILPSSTDPNSSLTVWGSSSSHLTLFILLVVSAIFLPLILLYTSWVYRVLWGKVRAEDLSDHGY